MNPRLAALLSVFGVITIGGVVYRLNRVVPGTTLMQLVDGGIRECTSKRISCATRIHCQGSLPDGGPRFPRYQRVQTRALLCGGDAGTDLVFRWPQAAQQIHITRNRDCFEPLPDSCRFIEDGCTDGEICTDDGGTEFPVRADLDDCACRRAIGTCNVITEDGGTAAAPFGVTLSAGTWSGLGCARKPCTEYDGDQGQSWPANCPGG